MWREEEYFELQTAYQSPLYIKRTLCYSTSNGQFFKLVFLSTPHPHLSVSEQGPGATQLCPAMGQETIGKMEAWEVLPEHEEEFFFPVQRQRTGTDLPERLWNLPHWRYPRSFWMQSSAMCSGMTLPEQGGWTRSPSLVPSNLPIPGLCVLSGLHSYRI